MSRMSPIEIASAAIAVYRDLLTAYDYDEDRAAATAALEVTEVAEFGRVLATRLRTVPEPTHVALTPEDLPW